MVDIRFYKNKGPLTLAQVAEICEAELIDASKSAETIADLASMEKATNQDIVFSLIKKLKQKLLK